MGNSLKITEDLLLKTRACSSGTVNFLNKYPEGITIQELYDQNGGNLPIKDILWALTELPITEEDRELILKYAGIKNCSQFYDCHRIENCKNITHSVYCLNSSDVYHSEMVTDSSFVTISSNVKNSTQVHDSQYVFNSSQINTSEEIENSFLINDCKNIKDSFLLSHCQGMTDCGLCAWQLKDLTNVFISRVPPETKNRILCSSDCPKEYDYAILNHKIDESFFNQVKEQLAVYAKMRFLVEDQLENPNLFIFEATQKIAPFLLNILPIKRLTEEDKQLFYSLTFYSEVLK
jgi:hypothetical protein